ncbi:MAG TPA: FISUMP domain-containing protein [Prolixibacteraceae bacterium]|nr:FISUMP domain-containing protein [Prolixibacteraceae bacterium]
MKTKFSIFPVLFAVLLLSILFCCKKEAIKTAPTATISEATNITSTKVTYGGEITSDGGSPVTERGICWSTKQNPSPTDNKITSGTGTGSFTCSITGLDFGTIYNVRVYAINAVGTGFSSQTTFSTLSIVPILTTNELSAISTASASSGGNILSDGGSPIIVRGVCWSTSQNPTIANTKTTDGVGIGNFTSSITGLTPGTTYYIRAYTTNSVGTAYGSQQTFTTSLTLSLATLTTTAASNITTVGVILGGNVTSDGNATVTERGVVYATTLTPTTANTKVSYGTGIGSFTSNVTGLTAGTVYYVRAYAINSQGTAYGSQQTFTTIAGSGTGTVTDIDGNVYNTITIGTQVWMAENLKTTKYRNGDPIPNVTDDDAWSFLNTGAYCWYNNMLQNYDTTTYKATYGGLYNWYAAIDSRNIAPVGWHVPTDAEWTTLTTFLDGVMAAGSKLKETGTSHWQSPNTGATNASGFTALPGGYRDLHEYRVGTFFDVGKTGHWWSSTEGSGTSGWFISLYYDIAYYGRGGRDKRDGGSVRCVKD